MPRIVKYFLVGALTCGATLSVLLVFVFDYFDPKFSHDRVTPLVVELSMVLIGSFIGSVLLLALVWLSRRLRNYLGAGLPIRPIAVGAMYAVLLRLILFLVFGAPAGR